MTLLGKYFEPKVVRLDQKHLTRFFSGIMSAAQVGQDFRDVVDLSGVGQGLDADRFLELVQILSAV